MNLTRTAWLFAPIALLAAACGSGMTPLGPTDSCASPNTACGAACTDLQSDPNNCGACGHACDSAHAEVCSQGVCALACGGGTAKCGASCIDTKTDAKNCGACGKACAQGEQCANGACSAACGQGLTLCMKNNAPACVSAQDDAQNCGKCGNVCGANNACVQGTCVANLTTLGAVEIQDALVNCTTRKSNQHKTAIDAQNGLHAIFDCGGELQYVASLTGGLSYTKPIAIGLKTVQDSALAIGNDGRIHVLATLANGDAMYTSSMDRGGTWSSPVTIDKSIFAPYGLGIATHKGAAYFYMQSINYVHVWRPAMSNTFAMTQVGPSIYPSSLLVDPQSGALWLAGDNGGVLVAKSTDNGATFGALDATGVSNSFTDYAFDKGTILVVGASPHLDLIDSTQPMQHTSVFGFDPAAGGAMRGIAVDASSNVYVATVTNTNDAVLSRVLAKGTTIDSRRVIASQVSNMQVSATSKAAFVTYTASGKVFATVQSY